MIKSILMISFRLVYLDPYFAIIMCNDVNFPEFSDCFQKDLEPNFLFQSIPLQGQPAAKKNLSILKIGYRLHSQNAASHQTFVQEHFTQDRSALALICHTRENCIMKALKGTFLYELPVRTHLSLHCNGKNENKK